MAITSGFFDSVGGDRRYNAAVFGSLFKGIITDGVFSNVGNGFSVTATGSSLTVGPGRAWYRGTWLDNDSEYTLTPQANSHPNYSRYDYIALQFDSSSSVRANTIVYIPGQATVTPNPPELTDNSTTKQIPICLIFRPAGASTVNQGQITMLVGTASCPYITGPMKTLDVTQFVANANNLIGDTKKQLNALTTKAQSDVNSAVDAATAAHTKFSGYISDAEKALGEAPNASTIIEAKRVADQAATNANTAKSQAAQAVTKATQAASDAKTAQQQASTSATTVAGFETRLTAAETNANKVPNLSTRLAALEMTPSGTLHGAARNYYADPSSPREITTPPNGWAEDITSGAFKKFCIGDWFDVYNGGTRYQWRVAAFDYFYDLGVARHHIVLLADTPIYTGAMNPAGSMPSAYSSTTALLGTTSHAAISALRSVYGSGAAFEFNEYVSDAVGADGKTTSSKSVKTCFLDMTETMVFGHAAWGTTTRHDSGRRDDQLPLFAMYPGLRKLYAGRYWLRNFFPGNPTIMMGVDADGRPDGWAVSNTAVHRRPIILLGA